MKDKEKRILENQIQRFKDNENISQEDKKLLPEYIKYNDRAGANAPRTKREKVRKLKMVLENNDFEATKVRDYKEQSPEDEKYNNKLQEINDKVVDDIQNSVYKVKPGEQTKREKTGIWTSWRRVMETQGLDTSQHQDYIPNQINFSVQNQEDVDKQANTQPEDLPTPEHVQKLLQGLDNVSRPKNQLRNKAFIMFLWTTGCRVGEALGGGQSTGVKMKHVHVQNQQLFVKISGNKGSDDRKVEVFQGRKLLIDFIENHPARGKPEAFLFCDVYNNQYYKSLSKQQLKRKMLQAKAQQNLDFKTYGEPMHIFRKGHNTFHVVNEELLSWEKLCVRQGKNPDSTMPDYVKMAMEDIDSTLAEGLGLDTEERQMDHRMIQPPLLPQKCEGCGVENQCYKETCQSCGSELPESEMPKAEVFEKDSEEVEREKLKSQLMQVQELADELGVNLE